MPGWHISGGGGGAGGSGDVVGPAASTDNAIARWDLATGKLLQDSSVLVPDGLSGTVVVGSTGATDNAILRADGVGGATMQSSSIYVTDDAPRPGFQFGGTTAAFSMIRPNGIYTEFLKADDSGFAHISAADIYSSTRFVANGTGGYIFGGLDTALVRHAAGVVRVSSVSTGIGALLNSKLVEPNTAGSGAPNAIAATESGTVYTDEGATAKNYEALPTAAAGYQFTFIVQDADGMRIVASADDTIRVIDVVTAAAGYIESTTIGSTVTLVSINAVEWFATSITGVWTNGTWTYDDTGLTT